DRWRQLDMEPPERDILPRTGRSRAAAHLREPPAEADEEKPPVVKELRRLSLEGVTDELEHPADDEQHGGPLPEAGNRDRRGEQRERQHDQRDSDGVTEPVDRVLMARRVLRDPFVGRSVSEHAPTS